MEFTNLIAGRSHDEAGACPVHIGRMTAQHEAQEPFDVDADGADIVLARRRRVLVLGLFPPAIERGAFKDPDVSEFRTRRDDNRLAAFDTVDLQQLTKYFIMSDEDDLS